METKILPYKNILLDKLCTCRNLLHSILKNTFLRSKEQVLSFLNRHKRILWGTVDKKTEIALLMLPKMIQVGTIVQLQTQVRKKFPVCTLNNYFSEVGYFVQSKFQLDTE